MVIARKAAPDEYAIKAKDLSWFFVSNRCAMISVITNAERYKPALSEVHRRAIIRNTYVAEYSSREVVNQVPMIHAMVIRHNHGATNRK